MVVFLKQIGTSDCCKGRLKMFVNTPASWSMQDLSACLGTPSGPVTFRGLTFEKAALTSVMVTPRYRFVQGFQDGGHALADLLLKMGVECIELIRES